jgi:hypothetical protein
VKAREPRHKVFVRARMNCAGQWQDITIQNVSTRGLLARPAETVPKRGDYVEVRRGALKIVARVVWAAGPLFGARTQDAIDIAALTAARAAPAPVSTESGTPVAERRNRPRVEEIAARSQRHAALFQRAVLLAGIVAVALVIGATLFDALDRPFAAVRDAMGEKS